MVQVVIHKAVTGAPASKLADAELHFTDGALKGLKLVGFAVWDRGGDQGLGVTFPARQYVVNGERRHYTLLRAAGDYGATEAVREIVIDEYKRQTAAA